MASFIVELTGRLVIAAIFFGVNLLIFKKTVKFFGIKSKKSIYYVALGATIALFLYSFLNFESMLWFFAFLFYLLIVLIMIKGYYITKWKDAFLIFVVWFLSWVIVAALVAMLIILFMYYV